jgi:cobalt-zinc-cadmium efflux system outer membrane protein
LLTELLVGLSNYQFSLKEHQLSERRVELGQEFLALAERRNRAGDIPKAELLTARLALAEAQAAMNTAQNELSRAQEQLAGISGGNRALWPALQGVPTEAQPSLELIHPVDLPELRFAALQTQVSRTRIRLAQKDRNPDPTLGVRYGEEGTSTLVGVSFSIPIPILNNYRAEVDAAQAGLIGAEQSYLDVQRRISARLQSSHERYLRSYENWIQWQSEGEKLLLEQRQLLQKLWQLGEINAVDYLVQLNQTFATESASSQLHSRLWNDWFLWLDASGSTSEWTENLQ